MSNSIHYVVYFEATALSYATPTLFRVVMMIGIRYWISRKSWEKEYTTHILYPSWSSLQVWMCFRKIVFLESTKWKCSNLDERWGKPIFRLSLRVNSLVHWWFGKQFGCFLSVYFWAQSKTSTNCCCIGTGICVNPSTERVDILSSPMYHVCEFVCFWIRQ